MEPPKTTRSYTSKDVSWTKASKGNSFLFPGPHVSTGSRSTLCVYVSALIGTHVKQSFLLIFFSKL